MALYAIGDVQGCFSELRALLDRIRFDPGSDRLWFVGDLVNRGPDSLQTLRFVKGLSQRAVTVLGNHDLHLIALACGPGRHRDDDTLDQILCAADRDELIEWLRNRPLLHIGEGQVMVHAGLLPQWSVEKARLLAGEVEAELRGSNYREFLGKLYGSNPEEWSEALTGADRLRIIVNAMTRMRFCSSAGRIKLSAKGDSASAPRGAMPWFDVPGRLSADRTIVCGHWSALGLKIRPDLVAIDAGCVWGGSLTAVRFPDRALFQVPCRNFRAPSD